VRARVARARRAPSSTRLATKLDAAWRNPLAVAAQWADAGAMHPRLLSHRVRGNFWDVLAERRITLLVTREYEHLLVALHAGRRGPELSWLPLPHPNGLAVDAARGVVHVASTRNPNQLFELAPVTGLLGDRGRRLALAGRPLLPVRSRFLPGSLYLHDLAMVGGALHATAVGQNAVIRFSPDGDWSRAWWPRAIETGRRPRFDRNYLQLNSIAAGPTLARSFFSASTGAPGPRRPGHRNFPVDRRGVIFSGRTREVVVRGLTRPHSARLHRGYLWVDDSGYGEVGVCMEGRFRPVAGLPGWTRGLGFHGHLAFVGTSRILPRFRHYAPGLDPARCVCGVHIVDTRQGHVLGSLLWPAGNQIFAVEPVPARFTTGLPLTARARHATAATRALFSGFLTHTGKDTR
jgi:uncharacterized protein (TIGR03032 family)